MTDKEMLQKIKVLREFGVTDMLEAFINLLEENIKLKNQVRKLIPKVTVKPAQSGKGII